MKKSFKGFSVFFMMLFLAININGQIKVGADNLDKLLPQLRNKKVALVINQTSCLSNGTHLLDTLLSNKIQIVKAYAPEHGIRGEADAGKTIRNGKDAKTGIDIFSIYGKNKKPTAESLNNVDIVVFDIQDVGARFYTYISSMHYVMEACAENNIPFIVLDRPNPNDYIDGPVLQPRYKSFVGMHPIPVLHGLTVAELAQMINGEGWLKNNVKCDLKIIKTEGWKHGQPYHLTIPPSPNLPNDLSIKLYASLCFFEATNISVGRGTQFPFQVIGFPNPKFGSFTFTPQSLPGFDASPLQKGRKCYGMDFRDKKIEGGLNLEYLLSFYKISGQGAPFFKSPKFMDLLAGTEKLRQQIINGTSEKNIRKSWESDLKKYKTIRKKYLLYPDKTDD